MLRISTHMHASVFQQRGWGGRHGLRGVIWNKKNVFSNFSTAITCNLFENSFINGEK